MCHCDWINKKGKQQDLGARKNAGKKGGVWESPSRHRRSSIEMHR